MTRTEVIKTRHPIGLAVLFLTEMWERFSYYGMRAILVYFMMKYLLFSHDRASMIYGLYTSLAYLTTLIGGWVADFYLGQRKTVFAGGVLMAIGQFVLAYGATLPQDTAAATASGLIGSPAEIFFVLGLFFLVIGSGLFKPNISTQVKALYPPNDARVDSAFSIFYVGINVGAFFSPLVCGTLGEKFGWKYGFLAAGIGITIGLIIYVLGGRYLEEDHLTKEKQQQTADKIKRQTLAQIFTCNKNEQAAILAIVILALFNVVNWAVYEQQGNVMAVWFDECTDRHIFTWLASLFPHTTNPFLLKLMSFEMPATWFQSVNPFMIFSFTPVLVWFWAKQAAKKTEPTTITKLGMGCIMFGVSYVFMLIACHERATSAAHLASVWWPILSTVVLTIGELYLSPVGLSFVTKVAPARLLSTLMGVWFLSSFGGNFFSGFIGSYWQKWGDLPFFSLMGILPILAGIGIFALRGFLERTSALAQEEKKSVE